MLSASQQCLEQLHGIISINFSLNNVLVNYDYSDDFVQRPGSILVFWPTDLLCMFSDLLTGKIQSLTKLEVDFAFAVRSGRGREFWVSNPVVGAFF